MVAACFRLAHTVQFARETDSMYLIGPLLFWACAEMTCGFFILSMPCLSKLIIESGLPRRIKVAFGYASNSNSKASSKPIESGPRSGRSDSRPIKPYWMATETTWSRLEEGDIALENTPQAASESQTNLRSGGLSRKDSKGAVQVTRTVDVSVSDSHSGSERESPRGWM